MSTILEISFEEMRRRVMSVARPLPAEKIRILESRGRVLAERIRARGPVPPVDKSAMDGFAVRVADIKPACGERPVTLRITDTIAAGAISTRRLARGSAVRIMTGAPLPPGADCVVPVEYTRTNNGHVTLRTGFPCGNNVLRKGTDMRKGQVILERGTVIGPSQMGMLAMLDQPTVSVHRRPRVGILTTGDELGEVGRKRPLGHIPDSNRYGLYGLIESAGCVPVDGGRCGDDTRQLRRALTSLARKCDFVISSGGVSAGDFDVVKILFCSIGGVNLYRLPIKPGKPQAFGCLNGVPYFGLPGNPVSAMVVFDFIVRPALLKMTGRAETEPPGWSATVEAPFPRKSRPWEFPRVYAERRERSWIVRPVDSQRSSDLRSMTDATGYVVLPPSQGSPQVGESVWYIPFIR